METVQQNGRFTLFSSKFLSIYSILYDYRLVELEKLRLRTRKDEEKVVNDLNGVDPFLVIRLVIIFNKTCLEKRNY